MIGDIPHLHIVVGACAVAVAGYLGFSIYVVIFFPDATMVGDIIGTWKSFAVAAFAFWIGASSGGKARDRGPTGAPEDPVNVKEKRP